MPSDESKGSQLDAIGSLDQRQLDNTPVSEIMKYSSKRKRHSPTRSQKYHVRIWVGIPMIAGIAAGAI